MRFATTDPRVLTLVTCASGALLYIILSLLRLRLRAKGHPLHSAIGSIRNVLLPLTLLIILFRLNFDLVQNDTLFRIAQTLFWIGIIWIVPSLIKGFLYVQTDQSTWRAKVPELFLDLLRFSLIAVGASLVFAGVWGKDLGGFFATLGIGSIVLGFALQDTLGNLMAGIALLFERPFSVGDWIKVGDTIGEVMEMNWRAVRIRPRSLDLVVVPNSVLGKEKIQNFSRPTDSHGIELEIGFSYNDPPNKVKRILIKIAGATRGVSPEGIVVRTRSFGDFAVVYQVRFFITDYARLPDIQEDFMTQVWYAVRRNGLTIPYPIRNIFKTEVPFTPPAPVSDEIRQALSGMEIFSPLSSGEIELLARDAIIQEFAKGERVVYQGDEDDALYLIREGHAVVSVMGAYGTEQEVARLSTGDFFGEMALLTGEPRAANVTAVDDLQTIVIYKSAMQNLFRERPTLAEAIAVVVDKRRVRLAERAKQGAEVVASVHHAQSGDILGKIKSFFWLK